LILIILLLAGGIILCDLREQSDELRRLDRVALLALAASALRSGVLRAAQVHDPASRSSAAPLSVSLRAMAGI
jgi:hypothetical protein